DLHGSVAVPFHLALHRAGADFPQEQEVVLGTGEQLLAVGRKSQAADLFCMLLQRSLFVTTNHVPQDNLAVAAGLPLALFTDLAAERQRRQRAVGRKGHRRQTARKSLRAPALAPALGVPTAQGRVGGAGGLTILLLDSAGRGEDQRTFPGEVQS